MKLRSASLAVLVWLSILPAVAESDSGWWQWRGPERTGHAPGKAWPADLDGLELMWHVELGKGYSGPIVAADRVFVVETADDETAAVRALDRADGKELWRVQWPSSGKVPFFARRNGDWVRSTPAFDGTTLYVGDMREVLLALDGKTGEIRWRANFPARHGTGIPDFGFATSPLVDGEHLYVQAANSLLKLDKRTGTEVWRALQSPDEMSASGAFSSPVIAEIHGRRQLVVLTRHLLNGVALEDGDVLWSHKVPSFRGMNIMTPVVVGNSIFTSPYKQRSFLYRVVETDGSLAVEEAWTNKATGYMSTPVVIDGHVFMHLGNERIDCIDLATGKSRWRSQSFGPYGSMAYNGDRILALDADGTLHLVRANPERLELLDSARVSEQETWGHIAITAGEVFVRELESIRAYRWSRSPS